MPQHNVGCIVIRCATFIFQLEVSTFTTDRVQPWYCHISNFVCSWHQFEFRRSISHYCSASFLLRFCVDVLHGFSYVSPTLYSDFCKLSSFIMSVFGLKVNCKAMQNVLQVRPSAGSQTSVCVDRWTWWSVMEATWFYIFGVGRGTETSSPKSHV
jgi:hypothetical protein